MLKSWSKRQWCGDSGGSDDNDDHINSQVEKSEKGITIVN